MDGKLFNWQKWMENCLTGKKELEYLRTSQKKLTRNDD